MIACRLIWKLARRLKRWSWARDITQRTRQHQLLVAHEIMDEDRELLGRLSG